MIEAKQLTIGYTEKNVVSNLSLEVEAGQLVSIIGPNGSGKSTLLKTLSRYLKPKSGLVYLEKEAMEKMDIKEIAKKISTLSQHNRSPEDITVRELIYYGRMPHKKWYQPKNQEDEKIIEWAIRHTSLRGFEDNRVMSLSGGERQRVWIAMALAQRPQVLLLDEPTTYLDICHQLEVMELVQALNRELNLTVIMVLHDLNHAAKYSHRVVVMKDGALVAEGAPAQVLTEALIQTVYNVEVCIRRDFPDGELVIHPIGVCKSCEERCCNE